jgi:predicted glycosyltransferase
VHADPRFARLEESFKPDVPLRVPVHYTGFVAPADALAPASRVTRRARRVVVSAGGGLVGEPLLRTAIEAQPRLWAARRLGMLVVAGPLLPEDAWRRLQTAAAGRPGLELRRAVPNLCDVLRRSALSVSQCGYNTALDVARAGVRALYVPYAAEHETEQTDRARRLARMSAARVLDAAELSAERLAAEIAATASFRPAPLALDLTGAARSARLLDELLQERLDADRAPKAAPLTQLALPGGVR